MTTRRQFLTLTAAATAVVAGCREPARRPVPVAASPVPDLVYADTRVGLVVLRGSRRENYGPLTLVPPNGDRLYQAGRVDSGVTQLARLDPLTGVESGRISLAGPWAPRVISTDGLLVALTPDEPGPPTRTRLVIASADGERHRFDLKGNIEPDAFTSDGSALFVLQWLPADNPDHYLVRQLDFATGQITPLPTAQPKLPVPVPAGEEDMRGTARHAVLSADRAILYTLYTNQPHAFVHVLHLGERWSYCLDLPEPFGRGPAAGHAMALTPDGSRLLVADLTSGRLVVVDTGSMIMVLQTDVPKATGAASAVMSADGVSMFLGTGDKVRVVHRVAGEVTATWPVGGDARGLALSRDGYRLYVAGADRVTWHRSDTGEELGRVPVDMLTGLRCVR